MSVNSTKLTTKLKETWLAHAAAAGGFVLGVFAPLPATICLGVFVLGAMAHEIKISYDEENKSFGKKAQEETNGMLQKARNYMLLQNSDSDEEKAVNKTINMVSSSENRHIAMASITAGTLTGILIGLVSMLAPAAVVMPAAVAIVATMISLVFASANYKELNKALAGPNTAAVTPERSQNAPSSMQVSSRNGKGNGKNNLSHMLKNIRNKKAGK